ncbi:hypothetical protein ACFSTE_16460 [Aquimarina hainanensis]|uniref:Uncharacterized protein n=1 Tax=Aquimarina hainanensis TaxID=1578017 RepID=A0ABW5NDY2_9FLAO|nr:hypothetical protein [Aquimarina sp. TRL1]QKX07055.1 hypothetical protein HN014_19765 [Aquimarina sp. TRL1]
MINSKDEYEGDENILIGIKDNDEWKTAFLRLVCDIWSNKNINGKDVYEMDFKEIRELFINRYNYTPPSNLRITLTEYKGQKSYKRNLEEKKVNGWYEVLKDNNSENAYFSTVQMMVPPKPENDEDLAAAVTDYMAAGKAYPFTIA